MRRLVLTALIAASLTPGIAAAQTLTPDQQIRENQRNLELQQERDKAATDRALRQSQALTAQAQQNAAALQAQGQPTAANPGLQAPALPYASSSAAARAQAQAQIGTGVPASAVVSTPQITGGPLNLPGPTDPAVKDFAKPNEPAANQPASTTPVLKP